MIVNCPNCGGKNNNVPPDGRTAVFCKHCGRPFIKPTPAGPPIARPAPLEEDEAEAAEPTPRPPRPRDSISALAILRVIVWVACVLYCLVHWGTFTSQIMQARLGQLELLPVQQIAAAGEALVHIVAAFIVALAFDRSTRLR